MRIEAELGAVGKVGADLDEERAKVLVHAVEIIEVDHGGAVIDPGNGSSIGAVLANGPGDPGLLLNHADKDHPFACLETPQMLLEDVILPLALLEANQRNGLFLEEIAQAENERIGHFPGLLGRGEAIAPVETKETGHPRRAGQPRDIGVEIHAVDAFELQDDMFALELGQTFGYIHGGSGWAFVTPYTEIPPPC